MNIAYLVVNMENIGGIEKFAADLAEDMETSGHGTEILTVDNGPLGWTPYRDITDYDIVHQFEPLPILSIHSLYARLNGVKTVMTLAGTASEESNLLYKYFSALAPHAITSFSDYAGSFFPRSSQTIYPGSKFDAQQSDAEDYLITVARIDRRKNLDTLIAAMDGVDTELKIAGGVVQEEYFEELKQDAPGNVTFLGEVPNEELPGLYANAAAFVLPSYHEMFGLVFAEAMMSGLPIISTKRACIPEVVGDAGILLDDPDDTEQLREEITGLLADDEKRARLAEAALDRGKQFNWKTCSKEYAQLYETLRQK